MSLKAGDYLQRLSTRAASISLFDWSHLARARNLLESLTEAGADIRQGVDVELLNSERQLREQIDVKAERLVQLLNGT